jgi:transcriptional regulator with XRE-family HTH domain
VSTGQNSARLPSATAIGSRLRNRRRALGLAVRELARRTSVSSSLISQIELGKSMPSVTTLYAIVSALDLSLDQLFVAADAGEVSSPTSGMAHRVVVKASERETLRLGSGVRWERLTSDPHHHTEFNFLFYEPGGASSDDGALVRHPGAEYGIVTSGRLSVQLASEIHELGPGDSISFESWTPHRLATVSDEPVHAVWVVVNDAAAAGAAGRALASVDMARASLRRS